MLNTCQNFKKYNHRETLVDYFWGATNVTTVAEFDMWMNDLKTKNLKAYEWLNVKDPKTWTKSHYRSFSFLSISSIALHVP